MIRLAGFLTLTLAMPVFADGHQPDISDLVADSVGYVNIRENVVILEGDEMETFICKFDVPDAAFEAYANAGSLGGNDIGYVCIPIKEFGN
ncbi:MAG: hypothetical protein ABJH45_18220 [Paracoccaceae bacterium]